MEDGKYSNRRRRRQQKSSGINGMIVILAVLFIVMAVMLVAKSCSKSDTTDTPATSSSEASTSNTESSTPDVPRVVSTASVGVTGDVLMHKPVIDSATVTDGNYDFSALFTYIQDYYKSFDFMVANLETTLGGTAAGEYSGNPYFNCPDGIVDALKNAGVDMLLTANNHTYDTGANGFIRTQQVIKDKGLLHLGTRESESAPNYIVQEVNGIKIGMLCYTYETGDTRNGEKSLNFVTVKKEHGPLINSFDYNDIQSFYTEVQTSLNAMRTAGAEVTMMYIHWGDEYQLTQNVTQESIAQQLCELGVDVIVGGHPHVVQPFDTLTSSTGHKSYCIYSLGNAVSNQRRELMSSSPNGHTEDGVIFGVEFTKWSNGTVEVSGISILPTWVNKQANGNTYAYTIVPLDVKLASWEDFNIQYTNYTYGSYERTMTILGTGVNECRQALGLQTLPLTNNKTE